MMERAAVALVIIALQALEAFLFVRGLKLPPRWSFWVLIIFGIFNLPLPYVLWLQAGARQPSFLAAALVVRPFYAWQFNWLCFLVFLAPIIILANIAAGLADAQMITAVVRYAVIAIVGTWGIATLIGLYNISRPPAVKSLELTIPGLAEADDGIRVLHLSDPHVAWWNSKEEACRMGEMMAGLDPDLLVITGDMVDHHPDYVHALADCLEEVKPRLGRYAIIGNHDIYTGRGAVAQRMEDRGFRMLRDESISLVKKGAGLVLVGIEDSGRGWTGKNPTDAKIPGIIAEVPPGLPVIMLAHRPTAFDHVKGLPVALTLAGHTHGGQVRLPFGGPGLADITFEHTSGLHRHHGQALYVSPGTGTVGWPFRLGCPAEVTLITLRGKSR